MFCYFNALKDELISFNGIEEMFDNVRVTYQRNILPHETLNTNLSFFLQRIEHREKSKAGLIKFFTELFSHPRIMLGEGKPSYNSIPQHNIDWKSSLDERYNQKFIEKITKSDYVLIRSFYIQEDKKSKQAKKGKSQSMFLYINASLYSTKDKDLLEIFKRIDHLNFIDSLIFDADVR